MRCPFPPSQVLLGKAACHDLNSEVELMIAAASATYRSAHKYRVSNVRYSA
jgi:hypothetical protein